MDAIASPHRPITLTAINEQAERVKAVVRQARGFMLAPNARKTAPTFTTAQLMERTEMDKSQVDYRIRNPGDLPTGRLNGTGSRREFTLEELRAWVRSRRSERLRPPGAEAITITTAHFKGGSSKTTTSITLAQGLSLRGHRVLVIDSDPQGSMTTLFGLLPDAEVDPNQTILPLYTGEREDVTASIQPTYWDGIDLVPAASFLFSSEFILPARQAKDRNFQFWRVLDFGLDTARQNYDVIIIDTPPSLSYLTVNALMASNGIIMPLPPNNLDFASSAQFWDLFSDLTDQLVAQRGGTKEFAFIDVLLSKVKSSGGSSSIVREWIAAAYAEKVLPVEIPESEAVSTASKEFGTIYDTSRENASTRTFKRAFEAYDRFVDLIEGQIQAFWRAQVGGQ